MNIVKLTSLDSPGAPWSEACNWTKKGYMFVYKQIKNSLKRFFPFVRVLKYLTCELQNESFHDVVLCWVKSVMNDNEYIF